MSLTLPVELLKRYPNKYFVETGTFRGEGVTKALDAGFENIYSIELDEYLYKSAKTQFINDKRVNIVFGDTVKKLWSIIEHLDSPITFWLDAHYSGAIAPILEVHFPLLKELQIIAWHPIKIHTLLIDDLDLCGKEFPFCLEDVERYVYRINHTYKLDIEDSLIQNKKIMVAHV